MSRTFLKRHMPDAVICVGRLLLRGKESVVNYFYDAKRFLKYSSALQVGNDLEKVEAHIRAHCHSIERGLSLKNTKIGFGKDLLESLVALLHRYIKLGGDANSNAYLAAISVLEAYINFHQLNEYQMEELASELKILTKQVQSLENVSGGTIEITKDSLLKSSKADFSELSANRYSIRHFSNQKVGLDIIKSAVSMAQKAPPVCNRQSARVYVIQDGEVVKNVLKLHNGMRGCEDDVKTLLIVTSDLFSFFSVKERNQSYIDGGIFLMELLHGLNYEGLGACALNWSVDSRTDACLRSVVNIRESENVVAMIMVGHLPDKLKVAVSCRRDVGDILTVV